MTTEEINKRFAELAGQNYSEFSSIGLDGKKYVHYFLPDYCAHPDLVLEVMMKRDDWPKFLLVVGSDRRWCEYLAGYEKRDTICIDYILNKTGQLALKAIKWMEEKK
jgi:hypothetical protein